MDLKPIIPITPEEWSSFSGKAKWDSQVALRGPDILNSSVLKWFTSSVIRHRLSGVMRVGGLINNEIPFVILPSGPVPQSKPFDFTHFCEHVHESADWLSIPIAWVPGDIWKKAMFLPGGSYMNALMEILPHLEPPFRTSVEKAFSWVGKAKKLKLTEEPPCPE